MDWIGSERKGMVGKGTDGTGKDRKGREGAGSGWLPRHGGLTNKGGIMGLAKWTEKIPMPESCIYPEKLEWDKIAGAHFAPKRKLNAPFISGIGGRVPAGKARYSLIIQKQIYVLKSNGRIVRGTWAVSWPTMSNYMRYIDGKCLKCGSKKYLHADHFYPTCYIWIKPFFDPKMIQTLCKRCHNQMPNMKTRKKEGWQKFCYIENRTGLESGKRLGLFYEKAV